MKNDNRVGNFSFCVKYDTNRLKMKAYVVLNKDGVSYVIHILIIFPTGVNTELA